MNDREEMTIHLNKGEVVCIMSCNRDTPCNMGRGGGVLRVPGGRAGPDSSLSKG